ncbi:pilus assembly protein CpaB [Humibacillus xanthopallidus]|uniref:Pilus assembly protein CpaB n=1 Tax=Humibacillus xanthopallidus TaxID=412689 RepID=A0A543PMD5_9MICO|nr:RcpC/CpaB family pilus assembly protein [Humibacillus xanthopallidus]TQN45242.1 pilus assembly protein CpaB [Humibacillus xanthopallidus]
MNRRILAILVAIVLAVGGAVLVIMYAQSADQRAIAAAQPTQVWVSKKLVPAGTSLKDAQRTDLIGQTQVAASAVPAGALTTIDADNNNLLALSDIQPGEILLSARFGSTPVGAKAIEVPSGMLAMSVELSDPARVGKFVTPGSHIAIYQSYKIKDLRDTPEAKLINENDINGTSVLLPDLLVIGMGETPLAAPTKTDGTTPETQAASFLVTVAVAPGDAPVLVHGVNNRKLYAGLRGSDVKIDKNQQVTDLNSVVGGS